MRQQRLFALEAMTSDPGPTLLVPLSSPSHIAALRSLADSSVPDAEKLRGGYYTPRSIATLLAQWAVRSRDAHVLEPSCGDGELVAAAAARLGRSGHITAVEVSADEAHKAIQRGGTRCSVVVDDAFSWFDRQRHAGTFDACIGNPPFIRYQSFPEEHRQRAFALMRDEGLKPSRLTNAWAPFVVLATSALRVGGRLALVLPAELLQVGYASELRAYLVGRYSDMKVIAFRKLVFPEIQQETVLLLGTRGEGQPAGMSFLELDSAEELSIERVLAAERVEADLDHAREKWTQYFLSASELELVREVEHSSVLTTLGQLAEVDVGVVTGRNEFFVLNPSRARDLGLHGLCVPLVGRSIQTPGLVLRSGDWRCLEDQDARCLLLQLGRAERNQLSDAARAYVEWGEHHRVHEGYKCRIRLPSWWYVPSVWAPDAFLLRQIHDGPRIIENRAGAISTDTIHRVRVRQGVNVKALAAASVNSATLAFSEIRGRSYGGGVLELEPSEAEGLPFPRLDTELDVNELDSRFRNSGLRAALDEVDRQLLRSAGLTIAEIRTLRAIWEKLSSRRIGRKRR